MLCLYVVDVERGSGMQRVVVVGRLQQRSWEDNEGKRRSVVEVQVDEVGPSLRWASASVQKSQRSSGFSQGSGGSGSSGGSGGSGSGTSGGSGGDWGGGNGGSGSDWGPPAPVGAPAQEEGGF